MERAASTRWERSKHLFAILLTLAALLAVSALGLAVPQEARAATTSEKLSELRVRPAGSMDGYSRDLFPHWSDAQEYGWRLPAGTPDPGSCDVREAALIRDGTEEVVGSGCTVGTGRWFDPYTGNTYYAPGDIDIDHVVPLANAWRSGATSWRRQRRSASPTSHWISSRSKTTPTRRRATRVRRRGSRRGRPTTASTPKSGST